MPGCAGYISLSTAERKIRAGKAIWDGDQIRYLVDGERRMLQTVVRLVASERRASDVYVKGGFDIVIVGRDTFPHTQWLHGTPASQRKPVRDPKPDTRTAFEKVFGASTEEQP